LNDQGNGFPVGCAGIHRHRGIGTGDYTWRGRVVVHAGATPHAIVDRNKRCICRNRPSHQYIGGHCRPPVLHHGGVCDLPTPDGGIWAVLKARYLHVNLSLCKARGAETGKHQARQRQVAPSRRFHSNRGNHGGLAVFVAFFMWSCACDRQIKRARSARCTRSNGVRACEQGRGKASGKNFNHGFPFGLTRRPQLARRLADGLACMPAPHACTVWLPMHGSAKRVHLFTSRWYGYADVGLPKL